MTKNQDQAKIDLENKVEKLNKFQILYYNYKKDHVNTFNLLLHTIFVPLTILSLLQLLKVYSFKFLGYEEFNFGWLLIIASCPIYIYIDGFIGFITANQYLILSFVFSWFDLSKTWSFLNDFQNWQIWAVIQVVSWVTLIIGHSNFEGRETGLVEDLVLTLGAPVFVNIDIFYWFLGYKKDQVIEALECVNEDVRIYKKKTKSNKFN